MYMYVNQSQGFANYQTNPQIAVMLIKEAMGDEKNDAMFYQYLISHAPDEEDRRVIQSVRNDELKHHNMFKTIYYHLTGHYPTTEEHSSFTPPRNYPDGLRRAIFGESGAVELYRRIWFAVPTEIYKNMVFEIMTDEQKHAARYNYLYAKTR
ncbi:ferritin-like domain-containing protein [Marininema halotolerans]|uniref:Rubrerythrin n=1 Tax=Marininema halotolerans TaxID=1155944 RepID=A0A1I6R8P4_9BACL|nr:ferritin-like domain-containing protein [Marininema halotolerans]SFS61097.1 Rubrerythrin [Marininema halotolerans]